MAERGGDHRTVPTGPPAGRAIVGSDALECLRIVAGELAGQLSLNRIAAVVSETAVRALDTDSVLLGLCDETGRDLRVVHESGLSAAARRRLPAALFAASDGLRSNGMSTTAPLDAVADALVGDGSSAAGRSSSGTRVLAALIPPHEHPAGIVIVGRTHGGGFSREDRRFLDALAAISALALERLRLSNDPRHLRPASHPDLDPRFGGSHVHVGDMEIDLGDQEVILGERHARLTPSELRILLFLAAEPGRARTRREILRHLWHTEHVGDERACDAHISNLRRKIERDPARPKRVVTCRGVGYALRLSRTGP